MDVLHKIIQLKLRGFSISQKNKHRYAFKIVLDFDYFYIDTNTLDSL